MDERKLLFLALAAAGAALRLESRDVPLPRVYKRVTERLAAELGVELLPTTSFGELIEKMAVQLEQELWPNG